ncbi:WecB/TagA/CpsF family glycosyltransferase [Frisingicoccus sp.]|uniref:WecB/TagA/CpsF family glycosyltransferase n=1 Tax=Frisingicoccus sp. TaxID=1918627 RepID=UPI003AB59B25
MERAPYNKNFKRKVDTTQIPTCNILGVEIAAIDMAWLLDFTEKNLKDLSGDYGCVSNVHTTITASQDMDYLKVQNGGVIAIPDGGPLSTVGRKRGYKNMKRTTGPSYMGEIFKMSVKHGWKHYFYGGTEECLKKLYNALQKNYPGIEVAGMYSPPFRPLTEGEDRAVIKRINETVPDFVWIGLGAPKQENWMAAHQGKVNGFMVGVGAGFDFHAGIINRAPEWLQNHNLEWAYRLMQDPRRLFSRYWHTNFKFIWNVMMKGK